MNVAKRCLLVILFGLIFGSGCPQRSTDNTSKVELRRCQLSAEGHAAPVKAKCGFVPVPENWDEPESSRQIKLHVAVVAADTNDPQPDPLFFFAGGPGMAATEAFPPSSVGFRKILRRRDVVLIDQRGTGRSNPLRCEGLLAAGLDPNDEQQQLQALRDCKQELASRAELTQYTTSASIRDFDRVRQQLGYDRINIYGVSYGTRVALSFMRRFPKRVRAAILDGVVPQDVVLGPEVLREGPKRTKMQLLKRCAADPSCSKHFPKLAQELAAIEHRLRSKPPTIEISHPRTGKRVESTLDWRSWSLTLRLFGYSSASLALLPLLLHTAHEHSDYSPLVAQSVRVRDLLGRVIATGLENTVLCSEDWPFYRAPASQPGPSTTPPAEVGVTYGDEDIADLEKICSLWPHVPVSRAFKEPVVSSAPTLILSGEIDPVTPPANGDRVARTLSASRHVVVPGHGHGAIFLGCVPKIAADFIDSATVAKLDTSCVRRISPLAFFIDPSGPEQGR